MLQHVKNSYSSPFYLKKSCLEHSSIHIYWIVFKSALSDLCWVWNTYDPAKFIVISQNISIYFNSICPGHFQSRGICLYWYRTHTSVRRKNVNEIFNAIFLLTACWNYYTFFIENNQRFEQSYFHAKDFGAEMSLNTSWYFKTSWGKVFVEDNAFPVVLLWLLGV